LRWIGLIGPAISTVLASYIHKVYQTVIIARHLKLDWNQVYPWRHFGQISIRTVLCGVLLGAVIYLFGVNIPAIIFGTILFVGLYLVQLPSLMKMDT
jgi:hypothetical protein